MSRAVTTGHALLMLLGGVGLGRAAIENLSAHTTLAPLAAALFALALVIAGVGLKKRSIATSAYVVCSLLFAEIAFAAVFHGNSRPPAFVLLGRETGFWANAMCLTDVGLLALFLLPSLPGVPLKVVTGLLFAYGGLGFILGLTEGVSLETTLLGAGFLSRIGRFQLQPAYLVMNGLMPLALAVLSVRAVQAAKAGDEERLRACTFLGLVTLLPLVVGFTLMTRFHIPNLAWILGGPRAKGQLEVGYASAWNHAPDGSLAHKILVRTPGYVPTQTASWTFKGSIARAPERGTETRVLFSVKQMTSGVDVVNLTKADLEVLEDGQLVPSFTLERSLTLQRGANALVLVLDQSGSMKDAVGDLKKAAREFVEKLDPSFRMALITFAGSVHEAVPLAKQGSDNRPSVLKAIDDFDLEGSTAVLDAVHKAEEILTGQEATRKIIVVFTDGADNASSRSPRQVVDDAQAAGIPIHTIGLGKDLVGRGEDLLKDLAARTGGTYVHAVEARDLTQAFGSVFDLIACSYVLTYTKPAMPPPTVELVRPDEGAASSGQFEVEARAGGGPLSQVTLSVDGNTVKECTTSPCRLTIQAGELSEGPHTIVALAQGSDGDKAEARRGIVVKAPPPSVEIPSPQPGSLVWRRESAQVVARGRGIKSVTAQLDGKTVSMRRGPTAAGDDLAGDYDLWLDPAALGDGVHTLRAKATNAAGDVGEASASFKVQKPSIQVAVPGLKAGSTLLGPGGYEIQVRSRPSMVGVSSVTARVDGQSVPVTGGPPWVLALDGRAMTEGAHTLVAAADNEGGAHHQVTVSFTVHHPRFAIGFPGEMDSVRIGRKRILVPSVIDEENLGVDRVEYRLDEEPLPSGVPATGVSLDPTVLSTGPHVLHAKAVRKDGAEAKTSLKVLLVKPPELDLFVSARRKGRFLTPEELDRSGMTVTVDDNSVSAADVVRSSATEVPLTFGLVLDCSGSMREAEKFVRSKEAAHYFIELKRSIDEAAMVAFSHHVRILSAPTTNRVVLNECIDMLVSEGATALYDGIHTGIELVAKGHERRALFILSDGVDQNVAGTGPGSSHTIDEVLTYARESGVALYTIGLGRELKQHGAAGEKALRRLAHSSGGSYLFDPGGSLLRRIFRNISDRVQSQTRIQIRAPALTFGKSYKIKLGLSDADIELVYPVQATAR